MKNLRIEARGQDCLVRSAVCNRDSATTVLAHIRRAGSGGVGMKPHDLIAVRACSACHDAMDGRSEHRIGDTDLLNALIRTLDSYAREGLI